MGDSLLFKRSSEFEPVGRSRANSSPPKLVSVPDGLFFLAMMNTKRRYFLPSTQNYFGGVRVKRVLCDSGCSTILLPKEVGELDSIFVEHQSKCDFEITSSTNVGGRSPCLSVKPRGPSASITIILCKDILDCPEIKIEKLRFSLCTEDVDTIKLKYNNCFSAADMLLIDKDGAPKKRRTHAVLGQAVLHGLTLVKYNNCELYLDATIYKLPTDFRELAFQIRELTEPIKVLLPEDINDWEDDDFFFEDDVCDDEEQSHNSDMYD
jgi:hypothetical protein